MTTSKKEEISELIRFTRRDKKLTLQGLGRLVNMNYRQIQNIEAGIVLLTIPVANRLCKKLGITIELP